MFLGDDMKYERIKNNREDHDLTQREMATYLHVKRSTYAMWELGDVRIPLLKLQEIADYFQVSMQYLVGLTNDKSKVIEKTIVNSRLLGGVLKTKRLENNLTQMQVAAYLMINQSAYAYYEYGKAQIPIDKLCLIANLYQTTIDCLCGRNK